MSVLTILLAIDCNIQFLYNQNQIFVTLIASIVQQDTQENVLQFNSSDQRFLEHRKN